MMIPQNTEVQIIEAKLQNLKELTAIARRSFLEAYPQNTDHENMELYVKEAFTEKGLKKQLLSSDSIIFIMKKGGNIIGYSKLRWDRSPDHFENSRAVELERLYFLNEFKGQGYGSNFLQFCLDYSIKKDFDWMWLLVWDENVSGYTVLQKERILPFLVVKRFILEKTAPKIY